MKQKIAPPSTTPDTISSLYRLVEEMDHMQNALPNLKAVVAANFSAYADLVRRTAVVCLLYTSPSPRD